MRMANDRDALLGLLLGLVGVAIFSGTLPATKIAVSSFDPGFLTFGRATMATIAAVATLLFMRHRFPRPHFWPLLFVGLTLIYGFPGFMALAMLTVPSAHGGVVLGILPLTTAVFATLLAGERPSISFWVWSIVGAVIISIFTFRDGGFGFETGDWWLLAAALVASAGYVESGKLSHHMPGWEVICWALALCLPISLAGTIWFWQPAYIHQPAAQNVAFLYLGLGSMFLGFFAWNTGLKLGGLARIGQLQLLQTFFTLGIAALVLGETVTLETLLFAVAVLLIVVAGQRSRIRR